jgi:hypothetical protein
VAFFFKIKTASELESRQYESVGYTVTSQHYKRAQVAQWVKVVGLPNNSCKPITNTGWVRVRLCKLQKGCTRLAAANGKAYQLLAHGWWFSPGTPASSTTKTGPHDIAELIAQSGIKHQKSINQRCNLELQWDHGFHHRWLSTTYHARNTLH